MSIWFNKIILLPELKDFTKNTMADFLGIEWTGIGDDFLEISMPVNERTKQPYGILHGGASCVLAETVGSYAWHSNHHYAHIENLLKREGWK